MPVEIFDDIEQGSPEWFRLRSGRITASVMADVLARGAGKTRDTLMRRIAGERLTGEPAETYSSAAMQRGKDLEAEARAAFAMLSDKPLRQVAFVRNGAFGASPDSLIADDGGLEIKTTKPELMIGVLRRWKQDPTDYPPEHRAQIQGSMLITERDWWVCHVYCHRSMPAATFHVKRDPAFCAQLRGELNRFDDEVSAMVEEIKRIGG